MKLLLSLLFLIVIIGATVNSQFINFVGTYSSQSKNKCNTAISGVGYSIKQGVCVSNIADFQEGIPWGPNNYNFILNVNPKSNKEVTVTQYTTFLNAGCEEVIGSSNVNLNECNETPNFQGINVTSLTSVTASTTPQYQSGTLVIAQFNSYPCTNNSFLYATTYTNGYTFTQTNDTQTTYSCKNGIPLAKNCEYNGGDCKIENITANCDQQIQQIVFCQK